MKQALAEIREVAALVAALVIGLAIWGWWSCHAADRRASRMEFDGEDAN
jgi:hypothetical protein